MSGIRCQSLVHIFEMHFMPESPFPWNCLVKAEKRFADHCFSWQRAVAEVPRNI